MNPPNYPTLYQLESPATAFLPLSGASSNLDTISRSTAEPQGKIEISAEPFEKGCRGEFRLPHLPLDGAYAYIDVVYGNHTGQLGQIDYRCADFSLTGKVLCDRRSHSMAIPLAALRKDPRVSFSASVPFQIESAVLRADYYDFMGLRSESPEPSRFAAARDRCQKLAGSIPLNVQWFITWKCNFACAYCWQEVAAEAYRGGRMNQIAPELWAERIQRLQPRVLYLTGGEPTLYKKLPEFIGMLDPQIQLVMNTNFGPSFLLDRFIEHVAPDRFRELVLSLHATQIAAPDFFKKLEQLKAAGYQRLAVQMVLYPQHMPLAGEVLERCKALGVSVCFDPYVPAANDPVGRDAAQLAQMSAWVEQSLAHTKSLGEMKPWSYDKPQFWELKATADAEGTLKLDQQAPLFCPAGSRRVNVDETGDVYTCMSAIDRSKLFDRLAAPHYTPIGNIFAHDFKLLDEPILCWESFRCSSCDFQAVDRAWTAAPGAKTPPLPH